MAYEGVLSDPEGSRAAREAVGGLILNYGAIEGFTIALLRFLMPVSGRRKKLIRSSLRKRIEALVLLLEKSDLLEEMALPEVIAALKKLHVFADVRNTVAHGPYCLVGDKGWMFTDLGSAEPNFTTVQTLEISGVKLIIDEVHAAAMVIQDRLGVQIAAGFTSAHGSKAQSGRP